MDLFTPSHIVFVLIIALLIFGPRRLPELGSAVGRTIREFQKSMKDATTQMTQAADEQRVERQSVQQTDNTDSKDEDKS